MSVMIQPRGEVGGGVAAHLQCSHCGHFSKSHAEQLSHLATYHPTCLDAVTMGRLGNILMYQSSARLFHCSQCFYTSREFAKLYKHIITKHCIDNMAGTVGRGGGDGGGDAGSKGMGDAAKERGGDAGEAKERGGDAGEAKERGGDAGEGREDAGKRGGDSGGGNVGGQGGEDGDVKREGEVEEVKDAPNRKSSEEEEPRKVPESVKVKVEGEKRDLMIDGGSFRCLICGWRNKHKSVSASHVVLKHEIPKSYAIQAIKWEDAVLTKTPGGMAEDEEGAGLSEEMLKKEIEASAKVISFVSTRYICLICGWKTKIKGFAISHVVRSHNVECPFRCTECPQSFFLPSQLQHHVRLFHRPGRYACPFCSFRSEYIGGFRRHCSRCSVREEVGEGAEGGEETVAKEARESRKRRSTEMMMIDDIKEEEDD
uniref:C2H2-type domain-containing protein n=2 Tax=Nothobranchius korthausae TaxID=1143690 RepID=A0A1A8H3X0_9TELE